MVPVHIVTLLTRAHSRRVSTRPIITMSTGIVTCRARKSVLEGSVDDRKIPMPTRRHHTMSTVVIRAEVAPRRGNASSRRKISARSSYDVTAGNQGAMADNGPCSAARRRAIVTGVDRRPSYGRSDALTSADGSRRWPTARVALNLAAPLPSTGVGEISGPLLCRSPRLPGRVRTLRPTAGAAVPRSPPDIAAPVSRY
jgi:hypothetical protein